jgi:hypothetical protein
VIFLFFMRRKRLVFAEGASDSHLHLLQVLKLITAPPDVEFTEHLIEALNQEKTWR